MNSNIIIECSQKNAQQVYDNGDFEIKLAQPIFLENNDKFALSKTFLDNETEEEGIVVIPAGGVTLDIQVQPYIQFDDLTKFQNGKPVNLQGGGIDGVDNAEYLLYQLNKDEGGTGNRDKQMELITSIHFEYTGGQYDKTWGNVDGAHPLKFIAQDINGNTFPVYVNLPPLKTTMKSGGYYDYATGSFDQLGTEIYCKVLQIGMPVNGGDMPNDISLVADNTDGNWHFNKIKPIYGRPASGIEGDGATTKSRTLDPSKGSFDLTPRFFQVPPFTIPEGKYTPDILVTTINDSLNSTPFASKVVLGVKDILPSAFLQQSFNLPMFVNPTTAQINDRAHILVPANPRFGNLQNQQGGVCALQQPTAPLPAPPQTPLFDNFLIGTNLVELAYSSDTNKYYWNYLHAPIYDKTVKGGNPIISQIKKVGGSTPLNSTYIQQGKNGGVIFHSLSASTINQASGKPESFDFWSGVLGFSVGGGANSLIPQKTRKTNFTCESDVVYSADILTVIDGVNTTNAGFVIDDVVNKVDYNKFDLNNDGSIPNFEATSGFNNVIYAERSLVSNGILDTAYYLVEIQLNFSSTLIGKDSITRNISGIINRYYSKGSYTSAEGDPSFVINYQGEPTIISSMRIRILNPDKTVAVLGTDNTLFFEIIKAPPQLTTDQPPPPPQPPVKQK